MDVAKAERILEKYGIKADLNSPWEVYPAIKQKGDPLSFEEHVVLFDAFWELGNIKKKSNVYLSDELKLKFILGWKRLPNFWWIAGGVIQGTTIPEIVEAYGLGSREQRELWDIFHKLWPAASSRDIDQINKALGIYKIVDFQLKKNRRITVLDLGCGKNGNGISTLAARYEGRIRGFGIDVDILEHPSNVYLVKGTAERLPFSDNYFDVVYASHVIYYFDERRVINVMREALRVLKSEGMFIFDDHKRELAEYEREIIPSTGANAGISLVNGSVFLIVKY